MRATSRSRSEMVALAPARRPPVPAASSTAALPMARPRHRVVTFARIAPMTSSRARTSASGPPSLLITTSTSSADSPSKRHQLGRDPRRRFGVERPRATTRRTSRAAEAGRRSAPSPDEIGGGPARPPASAAPEAAASRAAAGPGGTAALAGRATIRCSSRRLRAADRHGIGDRRVERGGVALERRHAGIGPTGFEPRHRRLRRPHPRRHHGLRQPELVAPPHEGIDHLAGVVGEGLEPRERRSVAISRTVSPRCDLVRWAIRQLSALAPTCGAPARKVRGSPGSGPDWL